MKHRIATTGPCFAFFLLFASSQPAPAQGTVVFHNTGGGQSLVSEVRAVFLDAALQQPRLVFNFGFATDETPTLGTFLDSFSVTIQDAAQRFTAIYLTADATGIVWAPPTPGSLFVDPASITATPVGYPILQPVLSNQSSFSVSAAIPNQFLGGSVNVYFDLFDNLDTKASQGWFSGLNVVSVPEPGTSTLFLLGGALYLSRKRCKR